MNNRDNLINLLNNCDKVCKDDDFYIWGAGNTTELNYCTIENESLVPIAFVDKNRTGEFHNVKIISPNEVVNSGVKTILFCSAVPQTNKDIIEQIKKIDKTINYHTIDEIIFGRHKDEIIETYDLFESEQSKKTYYEIIKARIDGTFFPNIDVSSDQYFHFPPFKMRSKNEVFVDCGAFVGDTEEQYLFNRLGTFKRIVAIEPDKRNLELLNRRVERLRKEWCSDDATIDVIYGAVGKTEGEISIDDSVERLSAKVADRVSDDKVKLYSIDSLFRDTNLSFIKADIEGYEMEMLEGARESIIKYHPLLAICVYHRTSDLYSIPLFIHTLNDKYKFEIAHHYYDFTETVLYVY